MRSPCLFRRQQALKTGYFYWLRVESSNHLYTELNLGYLKGTKFCLESKASFIDISSIASFKQFLIVWLQEYCVVPENIHTPTTEGISRKAPLLPGISIF